MTNARASATKMGMDYLNRGLRQARAFLLGNLFVEPNADGTSTTGAGTGTEAPAPDRPPVLAEPALMSGQQTTSAAAVSGLARFAGGLLRQYAPAAIAAGNVLLQPMSKTASSSTSSSATSSARAGPGSGAGQDSETRRRAARSRRQELEAELASLHDPDDAPLSSSTSASENESTSTTTKVGGGGGGVGSLSFVEIVEAEAREYAASAAKEAGGARPGARKSGSWFGWNTGGGVDSAKKDA